MDGFASTIGTVDDMTQAGEDSCIAANYNQQKAESPERSGSIESLNVDDQDWTHVIKYVQ